MRAPTFRGRAVGLAVGYLADVVLADPRRGHPVAAFGTGASALERLTHSDGRLAGVTHTGMLLGGLAALGVATDRAVARRGPGWTAAATAVVTFFVLGGTSLARTGAEMAARLEHDDVESARALVPSLCGRDPASLDEAGIARATVESVAENTSDAQVAPLWWGAIGGVTGLLVYRGANTLDAMIGHRSPRYARFGWAAARFDDVANYLPARVTGILVAACAPVVGGSPCAAWAAWQRDAARHPSPNAGVVEAAFAGALDIRLGGPTQYAHRLEIRPTLGRGRAAEVDDIARSVRLSRAVQAMSACAAVLATAVCRSGQPSSAPC
ncbi:cobalamin biosynthesis protein [Mycolicibacterium hodleri]|uniref:Cobalamin biosynthesis protein CobD n=1 Tax=Mycolicibacterium hodleri TaxID=49897 RepID=A0A502E4S2_9MYCO|nr:cobalamin biosynthesis protein [Mycolicibacterium hodleri]TPG32507.1 cobalamin biosynthesis protein [Mycolicibacterium hodleri]